MQTKDWQSYLDVSHGKVVRFIDWLDDLSREEEPINAFLRAIWMEDSELSKNEQLEILIRDASGTDAWLYSVPELILQFLETQPFEWHDRHLTNYQYILKEFYQNNNIEAFSRLKAFLAKTKVGIKYSLYKEMIRGYQDDYLLKMDLGLLSVIRADARGKVKDLEQWEADCCEQIETCLSNPSGNNCKPSLYLLPLLAYLWREKAPDKLLHKCFELEYKWDRTPHTAVLNHLHIYFRQAIQKLCEDGEWGKLIRIKKNARNWVSKLIETALSHPSIEEYADQLSQKEMEHAHSQMIGQSATATAIAMDKITNE